MFYAKIIIGENMDEAGIRFLIEIYKDSLVNSDEVKRTKKENEEPIESVKRYLDRLEQISKLARENSDAAYYALLEMYYDRYVIKESNIAIQDIPAGMTKESIIKDQQKRIKEWVDYLTDPATSYPMWAKYWAFQGMLKMGVYNDTTGEYQKRTKSTVANFVEPNPAIIAHSISTITDLLEGDEVTPKVIKRLAKTQSFSKIYATLEKQKTKAIIDNSSKEDGIWIKYNQGSVSEAKKLSKSVRPYNTRWCTAEEKAAIAQVCGPYSDAPKGGDFYVYYTKDENGEYTVPRIAIRCSGHDGIGEIRGVDADQNLEDGMESILEKKLKEMTFLKDEDIKDALLKIEGLKELTEIAIKTEEKIELSEDEIHSLYTKKYGFGWAQDPKVGKVIQKRNVAKDFEKINDFNTKKKIILDRVIPEGTKIEDDALINKLISDNYVFAFMYASERLTGDKDYVMKIINKNWELLKYVTNNLNDDEEIVSLAIKHFPGSLEYASERLRKDPKIVDKALRLDESSPLEHYYTAGALKHVSPDVPNYREKVQKLIDVVALYNVPDIIEAAPTLQDDMEIIQQAMKREKRSLKYASKRIQIIYIKEDWENIYHINKVVIKDKDLIMAALSSSTAVLKIASGELRDDEEVILYAIERNGSAIKYCSSEFLESHPNIVYKAVMKKPSVIFDLDEKFRNEHQNIVISAISRDLRLINRCSEEFMESHPELVIKAVKAWKIDSLHDIPNSLFEKHPDFVMQIASCWFYSNEMDIIPKEYYSSNVEMTKEIIKNNPRIIPRIPKELLDEYADTMEEALIKYTGVTELILDSLPKKLVMERPRIILAMLLDNPKSLEKVPSSFQMKYPEIIGYVVYKNPEILEEESMFFDKEEAIEFSKKYKKGDQDIIKRRKTFKQLHERIVTNLADVLDFDGIKDLGKLDEKKIS